jgi:xylulokinase
MLFDLRTRTWSKDLLEIMGLEQSILPPPMPSGEIVGRIIPTAAQETGLPPGTPVATGGHDHICAALAAGAVTSDRSGPAGTAEAILNSDAPVYRARLPPPACAADVPSGIVITCWAG